MYEHLVAPGAVLIADLVAPHGEWGRRFMAFRWDADVRRQSLAFAGSLAAYQRFDADRWNWYEHPDPDDRPSAIPEHLAWLAAAGFSGADVVWTRAGHAVYGGYKLAGSRNEGR